LLPDRIWSLTKRGELILGVLYYVILLSVLFGVAQQFSKGLIYVFPSSSGFEEMYRYGVLRVPSVFASINAFPKIAFLLIPLAVLLNKDLKFAVVMASLAFLLAFSRQFVLGCFVSLLLAYLSAGYFKLRGAASIILVVTSGVALLSLIVIVGGDDSRNQEVDGGLVSVPERYIRTAVGATSIIAAVDNPIFGVGPGHFGGNIGKKFELNDELFRYGMDDLIPFFDLAYYYTDTLWPQLLAEYGFAGAFFLILLFHAWFRRLREIDVYRNRVVALFCFFQFFVAGLVGPVFNYYYFSVPIVFIGLFLANSGGLTSVGARSHLRLL